MSFISISKVQPKSIEWLLPGRIPLGAITLLDGDGGVRKSTFALNLAAMVSIGGALPGNGAAVAGGVLLLGHEDDSAATVRPRLQAMNANLDRIFFSSEALTFARDIDAIEQEVKERQVKLIVVDPISGFLGTDANREQNVRRVLTKLARMASRLGVAVLLIRHLTKQRAGAQQAGVGSVGIGAVARSGLIMVPDPAGSDEIILCHYKSNLGPPAPSLRLRFEGVRLRVVGESPLTANDLVKPTAYNERSALGEAVAFLSEALSQGAVAHELIHRLAAKAGVNRRTLRKAKDLLNVKSRHGEAFQAPWYWHLPGDDRFAPESAQGDLGGGGHLGASIPVPPVMPPITSPAPTAPPTASPAPPSAPPNKIAPKPDPQEPAKRPGATRFSLLEVDD